MPGSITSVYLRDAPNADGGVEAVVVIGGVASYVPLTAGAAAQALELLARAAGRRCKKRKECDAR